MNIKKGDLVMVVRGNYCCGNSKILGIPFSVTAEIPATNCKCTSCGTVSPNETDAVVLAGTITGRRISVGRSRLIKIDPPETGDSLPTYADLNIKQNLIAN